MFKEPQEENIEIDADADLRSLVENVRLVESPNSDPVLETDSSDSRTPAASTNVPPSANAADAPDLEALMDLAHKAGDPTFDAPGSQAAGEGRFASVLAEFPGDYDVVWIGEGGMGAVYKVVDKKNLKCWAVKLLRPQLVNDEVALGRFKNEALLAEKLKHPNIARIYDSGMGLHATPYLVMEYAPGVGLDQIIRSPKPLYPNEALFLFCQLADTFSYAHKQHIIHRDIKPSNIIVDEPEPGIYVPRVVDFGIAKALDPTDAEAHGLTRTGEVLGSPAYMSPEQCMGQPLDERSDIYAFGCVMYETLSGYPPFKGSSPIKLILKHLEERAVAVTEVARYEHRIYDDLNYIVMRCLEKDPADRYQSMDDLKSDLIDCSNHIRVLRQAPKNKSVILLDDTPPMKASRTSGSTGQAKAAGVNAEQICDVCSKPVSRIARSDVTRYLSFESRCQCIQTESESRTPTAGQAGIASDVIDHLNRSSASTASSSSTSSSSSSSSSSSELNSQLSSNLIAKSNEFTAHAKSLSDLDRGIAERSSELPTAIQFEAAAANLPDHFEIVSLLGQGASGAVFKVRDKRLGTTFAVKMLRPQMLINAQIQQKFEQEARSARSLTHVNVGAVYDYGVGKHGAPYIVMECLDGVSLEKAISKDSQISVPRAMDLFLQLVDAIGYAHSKGVLHRDIKPSNIILEPTAGGAEVAKLVDFGIAKTELTDNNRGTQTGDIVGSPPYMSPEQCEGGKLDTRSDIYSFGCVMYEALSGISPFQSSNAIRTILKHIKGTPRPLKEVSTQDIPDDLNYIVMRCIERDPEARYRTIGELRGDLEHFVSAKTIQRYTHRVIRGEKTEVDLPNSTEAKASKLSVLGNPVPIKDRFIRLFGASSLLYLAVGMNQMGNGYVGIHADLLVFIMLPLLIGLALLINALGQIGITINRDTGTYRHWFKFAVMPLIHSSEIPLPHRHLLSISKAAGEPGELRLGQLRLSKSNDIKWLQEQRAIVQEFLKLEMQPEGQDWSVDQLSGIASKE